MFNFVPANSEQTNDDPDYKRIERQEEMYKSPQRSIFEPSGKQILTSLISAAILSVLIESLFKNNDSIFYKGLYFIVIFILVYISSFLPSIRVKDEKEIQKFVNGAAPRNGKLSCFSRKWTFP